MPSYKVVNKHIYYASTIDEDMGPDEHGEPRIVRQMGPIDRVEVGTILTNVPAHVLAAFPDRFQLVPDTTPVPPEAPAPSQAPQAESVQPVGDEVAVTPSEPSQEDEPTNGEPHRGRRHRG